MHGRTPDQWRPPLPSCPCLLPPFLVPVPSPAPKLLLPALLEVGKVPANAPQKSCCLYSVKCPALARLVTLCSLSPPPSSVSTLARRCCPLRAVVRVGHTLGYSFLWIRVAPVVRLYGKHLPAPSCHQPLDRNPFDRRHNGDRASHHYHPQQPCWFRQHHVSD